MQVFIAVRWLFPLMPDHFQIIFSCENLPNMIVFLQGLSEEGNLAFSASATNLYLQINYMEYVDTLN